MGATGTPLLDLNMKQEGTRHEEGGRQEEAFDIGLPWHPPRLSGNIPPPLQVHAGDSSHLGRLLVTVRRNSRPEAGRQATLCRCHIKCGTVTRVWGGGASVCC